MASILRQIVASPRSRHPEAGLDLCYVTDNIIATSGPSSTYPQVAYRNPTKDLVKFLDSKHGDRWAIWEFRAEGTGYPDEEVYGRVRHYPWPDHHPPPFALIPLMMASMRDWLHGEQGRVVVVHCKAGKGRSGTVSCSYLISQEGWTPQEAMQRFTERRMRPGFGSGVSIPSQVRWISYADRWTKHGKIYLEQAVEVAEVHVWGLRDGVKVSVEGYVDEGKVIKKFHTFESSERELVRGQIRSDTGFADAAFDLMGRTGMSGKAKPEPTEVENALNAAEDRKEEKLDDDTLQAGGDVIFRPSSRVALPSSDINIDFERRNKSRYGGFTMVTALAHAWFNVFFEGQGPEQNGTPNDSGVFEIGWDAMDGIKGSSRKGTRAFDRMAVVWKAVKLEHRSSIVITEPAVGAHAQQTPPADWRGEATDKPQPPKLGIRPETVESAAISRASSLKSSPATSERDEASDDEELKGVHSDVPHGEYDLPDDFRLPASSGNKGRRDDEVQEPIEQAEAVSTHTTELPHVPTHELPDGKPEDMLTDREDVFIGKVSKDTSGFEPSA